MAIEAARIEHNSLPGLYVDLDVAIPQVAVTKRWLDASSASLQRPQKTGDNLLHEFVREVGKHLIVAVDTLGVGDVTQKLATPEMFPACDMVSVHVDIYLIKSCPYEFLLTCPSILFGLGVDHNTSSIERRDQSWPVIVPRDLPHQP